MRRAHLKQADLQLHLLQEMSGGSRSDHRAQNHGIWGKKNIDTGNLGEITPGECTTAFRGMEASPQNSLGVVMEGGES